MTTVADYNRRTFNHFMPGHRYAGCRFIPKGALSKEPDRPAFFSLQAGPGVVDMSRDEMREFITGLNALLKQTEGEG